MKNQKQFIREYLEHMLQKFERVFENWPFDSCRTAIEAARKWANDPTEENYQAWEEAYSYADCHACLGELYRPAWISLRYAMRFARYSFKSGVIKSSCSEAAWAVARLAFATACVEFPNKIESPWDLPPHYNETAEAAREAALAAEKEWQAECLANLQDGEK